MSKILCIYHGACDDGFAAAWCVRKALGENVEFYPGVYQKDPPEHEGRDVIFLDFSYKRPVLEAMASKAKSILIFDHHKTAQEDLADIPSPAQCAVPLWSDWLHCGHLKSGPTMGAMFDMERSGAALAWDYFIGGQRPQFIEYIQDRDLWRKALPNGDEFTIALRSYPQDFVVWDHLIENMSNLFEEGKAIQRYYRCRIDEMKRSAYLATLGGQSFWISNAPYFAASEVAGELSELTGYGACYFEAEGGRYQYSLRSRGDCDVSAIARIFGGGGHKNAAGFSVPQFAHFRT